MRRAVDVRMKIDIRHRAGHVVDQQRIVGIVAVNGRRREPPDEAGRVSARWLIRSSASDELPGLRRVDGVERPRHVDLGQQRVSGSGLPRRPRSQRPARFAGTADSRTRDIDEDFADPRC